LTLPTSLAAGTYELRLFANNGYTRLAVSSSITVVVGCAGTTLGANPTSIAAGGSVTATWSAVCAPTSTDWIGLFAPGAANTTYLTWRTTTGTASGNVPFTIPAWVAPGTYELRLFSNGGFTSLAVSGGITVTAPCAPTSLSASPTSIGPGGSLTATWSSICAPTGTDWIGLFAPGAPNNAPLASRNTTGTASGNVPFTIPASLAAGTYELRLFSNGGFTRLALSNSFAVVAACGGTSLSASPTSIAAGGSVTATWSGICAPKSGDWIGLYTPGAPDTSYRTWRTTTGTASGSVPFTIPASLAAGTYELRLFSSGSYTRLAVSGVITVTAPCSGTSLTAGPTSIGPGGSVTATWNAICGPTSTDWIGLFAPGAPNTSPLASRNTTGTASGNVPFTIPASLAAGTYELRLFSNGGYTRLAVSNTFSVVVACTGVSFGASPTSIARGGSVTATWSGICAPTSSDWIGLFTPGAADTSYWTWRSTTGTASGSVPLTIPAWLAPGTYELRLFSNGGFTRLGTSNTIVVTSP
jgi:hypothetical protein